MKDKEKVKDTKNTYSDVYADKIEQIFRTAFEKFLILEKYSDHKFTFINIDIVSNIVKKEIMIFY
ncbi:MAG: hypothetical protein LBR53_05520 [Deltaproteobacteria bacterium]|jgi:hypothetical protein|nr:hypothetical protein [Deltaproteobacteria bacterium]